MSFWEKFRWCKRSKDGRVSITINASFDSAAEFFEFVAKLDSNKTLLTALEAHLSLQDEKIAAFKADTDAKLASLGTSLDTVASAQANIAADEAALLAKLNQMEDLTPSNQAILEAVTSGLATIVSRSQDAASSLQSLADSLPDEPAPSA
jgi:uncharacterized FlgJ-related protein